MRFLKNRWVQCTAVFILLTPIVFHLAYLERGYSAIGGEVVFPFIPLIVWMFAKTIKDVINND